MMEMIRHVSFVWLVLAPSYPYPTVGFVPILAPPLQQPPMVTSKLIQANSNFNPAALESSAARTSTALAQAAGVGGGEAGTCCSLGKQNEANNRRRGQRQLRRRYPPTTLSAAVDAAAATAGEAEEEVAHEPGSELALREPTVQAFEAWVASTGCRGNSASLSHADFEGLRGIMTKVALESWQPIATVPASIFLQEDLLCPSPPPSDAAALPVGTSPQQQHQQQQLLSCPPPPLSVEAWHRCPWWVRLGVRLLEEQSAGEDSRLENYVGMLPSPGETGTPMNWSAEQLDRLHYPRLLSQVKLQRRLFKGVVPCLLRVLMPNTSTYPGSLGCALLCDIKVRLLLPG